MIDTRLIKMRVKNSFCQPIYDTVFVGAHKITITENKKQIRRLIKYGENYEEVIFSLWRKRRLERNLKNKNFKSHQVKL